MTSLFSSGLPHTIEDVKIAPDFRNILKLEALLEDETISQEEVFALFYPVIPKDISWAIEKLVWFLNRGNTPSEEQVQRKQTKKSYHFTQDASLVYSAFLATYGIDLTQIDFLHWWSFLSMFESLPEDSLMKKVMHWRVCDVNKLSKDERKFVLEMRKIYALKKAETTPKTIEEIKQSTHDYYEKRIALAKEKHNRGEEKNEQI